LFVTLFEGLMNQDADGNLVPGVATGYTTNDAKDVYTFTLRDNAMWSDGNPVTAHDFVYAWRRLADLLPLHHIHGLLKLWHLKMLVT